MLRHHTEYLPAIAQGINLVGRDALPIQPERGVTLLCLQQRWLWGFSDAVPVGVVKQLVVLIDE